MRIITAEDEFKYAVWHILNKIKKKVLPYPNKKVINYMMDIDVKHQAKFLFGLERDAIQFLKNERVIKEANEADVVEIGKRGTSEYKVYELYHFKILNKFDEFYKRYKEKYQQIMSKLKGEDISSYFGFDRMTFKLKRVDNTYAVINFYPQEGEGSSPFYLFSAFVKILKNKGGRNGSWLEAIITKKEITETLKELNCPNIDDVNENWLKNTKGNLIKKIPKEYKKIIKIDYYDRKLGGYPFALKLPS